MGLECFCESMNSIQRSSYGSLLIGGLALISMHAGALQAQAPASTVPLQGKELDQFKATTAALAKVNSFQLYQGLPHPMWEAELFAKEKASAKQVELHAFPFYDKPFELTGPDSEALRKLVTAPDTYRTYAGLKRCGGFHPDYAMVWKDGDAAYEVLVCFGCKEAKLYGPKTELLVDIAEEAIPKLQALLRKPQRTRPTRG